MAELHAIPYSPWSEKARWALDVRGIAYDVRVYQPILGEPALRLLLKRPFGRVSVPVFRDDGLVIADSFEIARYAAERGSGPNLFPEGRFGEVRDWDMASERGLSAGRALSLTRMLEDEEALREQVPRALRVLGPVALATAKAGILRTLAKYGAAQQGLEQHRAALTRVLTSLREALSRGAGPFASRTLLGSFSYADIAMSQVLAYVEPVEAESFRIGRASRRCYGDPALKAEHVDLLAWRDALYAQHRVT